MSLIFNEEEHRYYWEKDFDVVNIPSVSRLIENAGLRDYEGIDPDVLEKARRRGEQVDALIMNYEEGRDYDLKSIDDYDTGCKMFEAWLAFRKKYPFKVLNTQTPVYHPGKTPDEIPIYAGTPDLIIEWEGVKRVLELKCTSSVMECHGVQTWLYHLAVTHPFFEQEGFGVPWLVRLAKNGYFPWSVKDPELLNSQAVSLMMRYLYWDNIPNKNKKGLERMKK